MGCALVMSGCGSKAWTGDEAEVTTLGIDRDGHVTEIIVEEFNEPYYSVDGLRMSMEKDITEYLTDTGKTGEEKPAIVLGEVRKEGTKVHAATTYQTTQDYSDYTRETLWYGTLRQGKLRGYELPSVLVSREGGSYTISDEDKDNHVIVTEGHEHIVTPYRILACTEGVVLISETEADFSGTQGRAAVLLER